jgi:hypothetical protein
MAVQIQRFLASVSARMVNCEVVCRSCKVLAPLFGGELVISFTNAGAGVRRHHHWIKIPCRAGSHVAHSSLDNLAKGSTFHPRPVRGFGLL